MLNKKSKANKYPESGDFMVAHQWGTFTCFELSKKNGEYRTIYKVDENSKSLLASHLPYLESRLRKLDPHCVNHGFVKGRNCALNALKHTGSRYALSLDIKNFFPSVQKYHLNGLLDEQIISDCFLFGAPQQGLPTSPLIANIALTHCDAKIIKALKSLGIDCTYTRYGDDLTFSFDEKTSATKIKVVAEQILRNSQFYINNKKTNLQSAKNGRIIINGIGIDEQGIHPTRKTKKKLRAAMHQGNMRSARGLREWNKCKLPREIVA